MCKPVWVQVLWSECNLFEEKEVMSFIDFEIKALKAAMKHDFEGGYYKTKVNVLFDDGNSYECRLDLAPRDTHGFEQHAKRLMSWYEKHKDEEGHFAHMYKQNYDFLKTINWP